MNIITGRIIIGHNLRNRYQIPHMDTVTVRVGCRLVSAKMVFSTTGKSGYLLSPELVKALYLKKGHKLRLRYDSEEQMIHLGPTVGILATGLPNRLNPDPKSIQAELIYLSQLGKGYNYRHSPSERGHWASSTYPLPDVVYDRIPSRRLESMAGTSEARKKLLDLPYLKYFNPAFLNKWQVYQVL